MSLTAKINEINNIYHIAKIVPLFQSRPVFLHEKATLGKNMSFYCFMLCRKPTSRYEVMRLKEVMDEMMEKAGVNDESLESVGPTQVANSVLLYNMSCSITVVNMRVNTVY